MPRFNNLTTYRCDFPSAVRIVLILMPLMLVFSLFAQEATAPFEIDVTVNYIDLELRTTGGSPYIAWWISMVGSGDTVGMELGEVVHLINRSNVNVDLYSTIIDSPDSASSDTLWPVWEVAPFGGHDSIGFRWASLIDLLIPPFSTGQTILSSPSLVELTIPSGENRYLYGWFIAPTEGEPGERHRLLSTITLTPAMVP